MAEFKELNKSAIGARIRKRRELLGLSREELAEQLGVTAKFIGDIEYGEKGVSMKNLYRLKQILGVGADFLLEGAEDGISEEKDMNHHAHREVNIDCGIGEVKIAFGDS